MSRVPLSHPDEELLLRYRDRELPEGEASGLETHLDACGTCRADLDDVDDALEAYLQYRREVLDRIDPPESWDGFEGRLAAMSAEPRRTLASRWRVWLPVAAAVLLAAVVYHRLDEAPSVKAAQLLRESSARTTVAARFIRIKTRTGSFTRVGRLAQARDGGALETLFANAGFSWEDPLSARSFSSWRDQLSHRTDEVSSDEGGHRILTRGEGPLREASITLRAGDLRPMEERLEFSDGEWAEITEVSEAMAMPEPASTLKRPPTVEPFPARGAEPGVPDIGATLELRVLSALRGIDADLGEQISLQRGPDGGLSVAATGLDASRQSAIRDALGSIPGVSVRIEEAREIAAAAETQELTASSARARLERELGGPAALEKLTNLALESSIAVMTRAHALRKLAERFPASVETQLTSADRLALWELRKAHAEALDQQARHLQDVVRPVGNGAGEAARPVSSDWRVATQELFAAAERVDGLLTVLLAGTDAVSADQARRELPSAVARLVARASGYSSDLLVEQKSRQ
ncbi:MAG: hypothetical protein ACKV22_39245 [Bryobacteraceae bacterium]